MSFFLLQQERLKAPTATERTLQRAQFVRATSTEDTSECRAVEEYDIDVRSRFGRRVIRHPINYMWKVCMGRDV